LGFALAILGVIATLRFLANAYLAIVMGGRLDPAAGRMYLAASTWLLMVYLASAASARAYRTTHVLLDHPRFRGTWLGLPAVRRAALGCAVLRPVTALLLALLGISAAVALGLWGVASVPLGALAALLAAGAAAAALSYAALGAWRPGDRTLSYLETVVLGLLAVANPQIELADLSLVVSISGVRVPTAVWSGCLTLLAIPAVLALLAILARLARVVWARRERAQQAARARTDRNPLLRLYHADLPLGLLLVSYAVEAALVLRSAMGTSALLRLSLLLLVLRMGWYALFLTRTLGRLTERRPQPALGSHALSRALLRSAPLHAVLCLAPLALWLVRPV
jgi:hypothetical protein